jgi:hypothetical protein
MFASTITKIITDFVPEEVAVDRWLVYRFGGMMPFCGVTRVFLDAAYSLEWCDFCSEVGLEEKGDAGLRSSSMGFEDRNENPLTIHWRATFRLECACVQKTCSRLTDG